MRMTSGSSRKSQEYENVSSRLSRNLGTNQSALLSMGWLHRRRRVRCVFELVAPFLLYCAALPGQQTSWQVDANHSAAYFSIRHLMISTVRGQFSGINGTVHYDPNRPAESSVEATIACATVNTGVAKRDAQVKGPDFFDVAKD